MNQNNHDDHNQSAVNQLEMNSNLFANDNNRVLNQVNRPRSSVDPNGNRNGAFFVILQKLFKNSGINTPEDCYYFIIMILVKTYFLAIFLNATFVFDLNYMILVIFAIISNCILLKNELSILRQIE